VALFPRIDNPNMIVYFFGKDVGFEVGAGFVMKSDCFNSFGLM
jgi:hypothetical protein